MYINLLPIIYLAKCAWKLFRLPAMFIWETVTLNIQSFLPYIFLSLSFNGSSPWFFLCAVVFTSRSFAIFIMVKKCRENLFGKSRNFRVFRI